MNYMTKDEISQVLLAASVNRRDYLMIYLGYFAGLRAMEVCSLQRKNFDISTAAIYVTVQRSKGSDKTRHQLPPAVATLVREHIRDMEPNDYLFKGNRRTSVPRTKLVKGESITVGAHIGYTTFYQAFLKYCRIAGIPESLHFPHCLKHTAAMALVKSGMRTERIQKQLGHKNLTSTQAYLDVLQQETDAEAYRALAL